MTDRRARLLLPTVCCGYFLVLLDVTVVNVALPSVAASLDTGASALPWVVDGYAVALAALLLVGGTLGDVVGHRRVVLAGLALFGVASLGCGVAGTTVALVAARAVQGVGAALLLPGTLALLSDAYADPRSQARAIGVWAAVGSAALPAGPLLGGLLVDQLSWRWVFLVNVPIVVGCGVVLALVVPPGAGHADRRVDVRGAVAAAVGLASLVYAVIAAGDGQPGRAVAAAAVAVLAGAAFVVAERRAPDPMLPLGLLHRPRFVTANAVAGAMNAGTLGMLFLLTLLLQTVQGRSALETGLLLLPLFLPLSLLAPLAGRVTGSRGARGPIVAGLLVAAAGFVLLVGVGADASYSRMFPALLLWGVGLGALTPAVVAAAVAAVGPERRGLASGANNTARQAAGAIGIAVGGAIAGPPGQTARFVTGVHAMAAASAVVYLVAALASAVVLGADR